MKTILINEFLSATILHKGAEICSILKDRKEYIWNADPAVWAKHSPVLFPIVGTLKNDNYFFEGNDYHLPRHGFARDMDFELVSSSETSASFLLKSGQHTLLNYPFEFEFYVNYCLSDNALKTSFLVRNLNNFAMPFSVGAHPAFALHNNFEDYSLEFNSDDNLVCFRLEDGLISNEMYQIKLCAKLLKLTYKQFENDALVMKKIVSNKITLKYRDYNILSISFADFQNLGLWTKPNANFICIEPWLGYADVVGATDYIMCKEGIQILQANDSVCKSYIITIL